MGNVLVGTASWSDPGFVQDWYPRGLAAADRLRWYGGHFNLVELNSSFYGIPRREMVKHWCDQTPDGFVFDVKLHKVLSRHAAKLESLTPDLRKSARTKGDLALLTPDLEAAVAKRFLQEISPLADAGKLGALLLQLSPAFSPRQHRLEELEPLLAMLHEYRVAVELRNRNWMEEPRVAETCQFFSRSRTTLVMVDAPQSSHFTVMPASNAVTEPELAYLRLHGRDERAYVTGRSVAERFDYDYSPQELGEIAERVAKLAEQAREVHVIYNNNRSNYAPKAAAAFRALLGQSSPSSAVANG